MIYFSSKTPEWAPLSNMWEEPITVRIDDHDIIATSAEAIYQAAKCRYLEDSLRIVTMNPFEARRLGRLAQLCSNWSRLKHKAMEYALQKKFTQCPQAIACLKATGEQPLYHLSPWDTYWGVDNNGHGENHLGRMLIDVRNTLMKMKGFI